MTDYIGIAYKPADYISITTKVPRTELRSRQDNAKDTVGVSFKLVIPLHYSTNEISTAVPHWIADV